MKFEDIEAGNEDDYTKILDLSKAIQRKLTEKGGSFQVKRERKKVLRWVTCEEWIILDVVYFLICCQNSGLHYNLEDGLELIPELKTIGLDRYAEALQKLLPLSDEADAYIDLEEKNKITETIYLAWLDDWESRVERIEADAENDDKAGQIVWNWALQNRDRILKP